MHNMQIQANVEVIGNHLYNEDSERTPFVHGPLDRRMVNIFSFV